MNTSSPHTFHIPVMGLGFTIDSPVKVARFGISSVMTIGQDVAIELMREFYSKKEGEEYTFIPQDDIDHRAKRMRAYLNLVKRIVDKQMTSLKSAPFKKGSEIEKYFELLPEHSNVKKSFLTYKNLPAGNEKISLEQKLRDSIVPGSIDVNIMTKLDKLNYSKSGELLPVEYADAMSALRGYATSDLESSLIFSAGLNPRLFGYCETFPDFFPDENGTIKKKIILKVSDYRSALIQGKYLAKKGLFISEFRIESGLNCGGHAFPTEGILLGPILKEFQEKRNELAFELYIMCNAALAQKGKIQFKEQPHMRLTVQGGIGTAAENDFLMDHFKLDGTGWGSPFLLVPEATNVDNETLYKLATAKKEDYFLSDASPLGIPFNNFHNSTSEQQRKMRIDKGRPGSPCYNKYLVFNTEFGEKPICTASREYQNLKLKQLQGKHLPKEVMEREINEVISKDCICEGLASAVLIKNNIPAPHNLSAVTICPGPNLAYFSGIFSLDEMVGHIYGRTNLLNSLQRPHMFINELILYVDYLKNQLVKSSFEPSAKQIKYLEDFKNNLMSGIEYYKMLAPKINFETEKLLDEFNSELNSNLEIIQELKIPSTFSMA